MESNSDLASLLTEVVENINDDRTFIGNDFSSYVVLYYYDIL